MSRELAHAMNPKPFAYPADPADPLGPSVLGTAESERQEMIRRAGGVQMTLEWYAETFCEHPDNEVCGRLSDDDCAGCRARAVLNTGGTDE